MTDVKTVLEIFSDYIWPHCYFITGRIEELKNTFDITVNWRAFPLHPEIPEEGVLLTDLFGVSQKRVDGMVGELRNTADSLGLPFNARVKSFNSRLAQELGLWAEDQGQGDAFRMAAFGAYFADGCNLALLPVLLDIAEKAGLDRKEASEVIYSRSYSEKVDADWTDSKSKAVTAVPTCIMEQHKLIGAQSYEVFSELARLYKVPLKNKLGKTVTDQLL